MKMIPVPCGIREGVPAFPTNFVPTKIKESYCQLLGISTKKFTKEWTMNFCRYFNGMYILVSEYSIHQIKLVDSIIHSCFFNGRIYHIEVLNHAHTKSHPNFNRADSYCMVDILVEE
jgi:hypothetical protein